MKGKLQRALVFVASAMFLALFVGSAQGLVASSKPMSHADWKMSHMTQAQRQAAADRAAQNGLETTAQGAAATAVPGGVPDYFGSTPNYATSPLPPTVDFTGGGGSGAAGEAKVVAGVIQSVLVTAGGGGYTTPPDVAFVGFDGAGAAATATVKGPVTAISLLNGGSGYTAATVDISGAGGTGTGATATATVTTDVVSSIAVTNGGSGYTAATVDISGGNGTGATATANIDVTGTITSIDVTNGGNGYTSNPTVTINGDGTGATATATATGPVTGVTLDTQGAVYAYPAAVTINGDGTGATASATITGPVTAVTVTNGGSGYGGMRKFVDPLPGLPVATPDTSTFPGSDYYVIELGEYTQQLHSDLPPTTLRGYRQVNMGGTAFSYLGPLIVAQKDRPVRVKFVNNLPTGVGGNLFLPVDKDIMGAGTGPNGGTETYTENRATLHLHGGTTPWISDGTQHQWITPAGETTSYPQGVAVREVPDMPGSGSATDGAQTFFYTNQQSARLMFYHDHAYGITRLNVYAGEAAGYLLTDNQEQGLIGNGTLPGVGTPLVIQDKTFVPGPNQLAAQDPTWDKGGFGSLWFPHVYMPNQNPADVSGANAMGRWDYGPWFWPPFTGIKNGPVTNPLYDPVNAPWEPPTNPGTPNPSIVPEAFMDTPLVNGAAYPTLTVQPALQRFRVLNAANDRFWNLSLWVADPAQNAVGSNTEVKMVPFNSSQNAATPFPSWWYDGSVPNRFDDRVGGVPDPSTRGPAMVQIGTEGGFLPAPVVIKNQPVNYVMNKRDITVGNVAQKALFLGPAERADIVVDFSNFAGKTLILYSDAPAPVPAADPRIDYFTGDPDLSATGGAPSTLPGYGPNTRTIMQIKVAGSGGSAPVDDLNAANLAALNAALPVAYAATQPKPIVPNAAYNTAFGANWPTDSYTRIQDTKKSFMSDGVGTLTLVNGGFGYTNPTVSFLGGGGTGATATATLAPTSVASFAVTNGGSGYVSAPTVSVSGGGGTGATATAVLSPTGSVKGVTVTSGGSGYTSAPTVTFAGGGGSGATATATVSNRRVSAVNVTNGGSNYTSAPTVAFSGGGGTGAAATATIGKAVASVTRTNGGSGYASAPTVAFSGGGGTGAAATATLSPSAIGSLTLTSGGTGYVSAPVVLISGGGTGAAAVATLLGITIDLQPKSVIENFDPDYGRMNALLGVEVPNTTGLNQTSIPYADVDPPTEVFKNSGVDANDLQVPIGTLPDGTQVWKVTHNGVDTHALHWHMFNVQVINRVGWDGAVRAPDPNELGWKDTVRMNPLEDIIIALRPIMPNVPFQLPNSVRTLDTTMAAGADPNLGAQTAGSIDPANNPITVTNHKVNFGWEYVWHCHLLGHEENIMMRSMPIAVGPVAPINVAATLSGTKNVLITWKDQSINETGFDVYRRNGTGTWTKIGAVAIAPDAPASLASGGTVSFTDTTPIKGQTYSYRIVGTNTVGDTTQYAAPAVGFPKQTAEGKPSIPSNSITR